MYPDIPLVLSLVFIVGGLVALTWASDFFVDGASALARMLGISPFVIGMVVIGFGTTAPELCVSAMSGAGGHPELSVGNAYGSCSFNIAVILGLSALVRPLRCKRAIAFVAAPVLVALSAWAAWILRDGTVSRAEAVSLLALFLVLLPLYCWFDQRSKSDEGRVGEGASEPPARDDFGLWGVASGIVVGLAVLVLSSHFLVWGAVDLATFMGVSDLVIGLTIVAGGTSLPVLARAIASARRGEHEFVLGNIVGSNLFNTLAVVGIACAISPIDGTTPGVSPFVLSRDIPMMAVCSLTLLLFGANFAAPRSGGVIGRGKAWGWLLLFVVYSVVVFVQEVT